MNAQHFVSIVIPCYNEERFIVSCLDSIIDNDYPKEELEVLIVDGMSNDKTRAFVERYTREYQFIKLLDNPKRITPAAFNIGIKYAKGEVIIIMGAHNVYEKDYVSKCVKHLNGYGADNVGGMMVTLPRNNNLVGKSIVLALSNRFGIGGAAFRIGSEKPRWVDTVFGGCYKREVFDRVGLFNENLVNTQDMEFNTRLRKAGGKILFHPEIVSHYYARSELRSFCKHNLRNGFWAIYPFKFTKIMPVSWRHLVPLAFVSSLIGSGILSFFSQIFLWLFLFIFGSYALANAYFSIKIAVREKDFRYLFAMPPIFAILHVGYGLGSIYGAIRLLTG